MKNNNKNNLNNEEKQINRVQTIISISCLLLFLLMVIITVIVIVNSSENTGENSSSKVETSTTTTTTTTITPKPEDSEPSKTDVTTTVTTPEPETTTTTVTTPEPETTTTTTTTPKPETTTTTTTTKPEPIQDVSLDIEGVSGYTTYPSGSGISAVATVLKYYGIDASVIDLCNCADVYGDIIVRDGYTPSPWKKIVFSPGTYDSIYYAPPIVNMANKYLTSVGSNKRAKDVSGTSLEELLEYVEKGVPVIIWGTTTEKAAKDGRTWISDDGETVICKEKMQVFVIKGYTKDNIELIFDVDGIVIEYSHDLVNEMYQSVYAQALIIE